MAFRGSQTQCSGYPESRAEPIGGLGTGGLFGSAPYRPCKLTPYHRILIEFSTRNLLLGLSLREAETSEKNSGRRCDLRSPALVGAAPY